MTPLDFLRQASKLDNPRDATAKAAMDIYDRYAKDEKTACTTACYSCCYRLVKAEPGEAILAAHYARTHLARDVLDQITKDLNMIDKLLQGLHKKNSVGDYLTTITACPFLDAGTRKCLIYPVRPLDCRFHHSTDARACQDDLFSRIRGGPGVVLPVNPNLDTANAQLDRDYQHIVVKYIRVRSGSDKWWTRYFFPQVRNELRRQRLLGAK